jgi:hypothetical protein
MTPNLIGRTFNRLTVIERAPNIGRLATWYCSCSCGTTKTKPIRGSQLKNSGIKSCGCMLREILYKRNFKHGCTKHHGASRRTPEYISWGAMKQRCTNPKHRFYRLYGGAGVTICDKWLKFENFLFDMGTRPSAEYSIGRIKNHLGYDPSNCKWMTPEEQVNNTSHSRHITIANETRTITQWCRHLNIDARAVNSRIYRGWLPEEAIITPIRKREMATKEEMSRVGRSNSRRGKSQERHIAHLLTDWSGIEFRRRKVEGRDASTIARESTADVIAVPYDFRFSVEAKSGKGFSLDALMANPKTALFSAWWFQACYDAQLVSDIIKSRIFPMLFFKPNPNTDWVAFSEHALTILISKINHTTKSELWFPHIYFSAYKLSKQIGSVTFSKKNKITTELQLDPTIICRWKDFAANVSPNGLFLDGGPKILCHPEGETSWRAEAAETENQLEPSGQVVNH